MEYFIYKKSVFSINPTTRDYRIISYPFDRYEIKIKVTPNNEFIEIVEVGINKDFLTQKQKIGLQGFHDVEKFYVEQ